MVHPCNKETEIAEMHSDVKMIKKALLGNGQPGMLAEFNQAKGMIKFISWFGGIGGFSGLIALMIVGIKSLS